ncbi:putative toxin-antitoxin system antitoxin component, TIGR02293 family [Hymenobacter daecheongensis DSM 21074]|uniref:Putative toxin-antitoxin system antitoxin component, TIGR02293 family n=1 Tax=Hymenobacter daecheongensis DSM 21074 TaxID=1121955 RepID=A0A1M6K6J3_9BACT|nr:antitoxin Xre/MbcA/ParS toxin-binding domain-containing protein [Hymenobacter daecheongensis]SHJ54555.1 putative toxin-antitoxin system antitoxin component, TIGR02293 family [Hymenobacter daecheongensis DSM 21074]
MATPAHQPKITATMPAALRKKWAAWGRAGQDAYALVMEARKGVPAATAFEVAEAYQLQANELEAIYELSTKTLRTYTQENRPLSAARSEKTLKIISLYNLGVEVFGEAAAFLRWLDKPAHGLDQEVPLRLLETSGGIDLVAEELGRIAYGDLS